MVIFELHTSLNRLSQEQTAADAIADLEIEAQSSIWAIVSLGRGGSIAAPMSPDLNSFESIHAPHVDFN